MSEAKLSSNDLFCLLSRAMDYIEGQEVSWDWEVGQCRDAEQLIDGGLMPPIYYEISNALKKQNSKDQG